LNRIPLDATATYGPNQATRIELTTRFAPLWPDQQSNHEKAGKTSQHLSDGILYTSNRSKQKKLILIRFLFVSNHLRLEQQPFSSGKILSNHLQIVGFVYTLTTDALTRKFDCVFDA